MCLQQQMRRQRVLITEHSYQAIIWSLITYDSVSNEEKHQQDSWT